MAKSNGSKPNPVDVDARKAAIAGMIEYIEGELEAVRLGLETLGDNAFSDKELVGLFGHLIWGFNDSLRHATDAIGLDPREVSSVADEEYKAHEGLGEAAMGGSEDMPEDLKALIAALSGAGPETVRSRDEVERVE